jgi:hypothetical protein
VAAGAVAVAGTAGVCASDGDGAVAVPVGSGKGASVGAGALGVGATVGGAAVVVGLAVGVTAAAVGGDEAGTAVIQPLAATAVRMSSMVNPGRMVDTWLPRGGRSAGA